MPKLLPIVYEPNKVLRQKAKPIIIKDYKKGELEKLAKDMIYTMKKTPGVGLAAPQIGKSIRLIVVEYMPEPIVLINPVITKHSLRTDTLEEGCLSVPEKYGLIKRYKKVHVKGQDLKGNIIDIDANGYLAEIFQHEIDHLNGTLYIDKVEKMLN